MHPRPNTPTSSGLSVAAVPGITALCSQSLKAHPDAMTSAASFTIAEPNLDYSAIVDAWHAALPAILDSGTMATYYAQKDLIVVYTVTGYNRTQANLEDALLPFVGSMAALNVSLQPNYTQFDSYYEHYTNYYGPLPVGAFGVAGELLMGGRLLLRDDLPTVGPALNSIFELGVRVIGQAMNVSRFADPSRRAVLPQWRDAVVMSAYTFPYSFTVPFSDMAATQNNITDTVMPIIEQVTPNAGAYINEADPQQKDWQNVFFGSNYAKLLVIKEKYDPKGLFYNRIAVGSERWKILEDGRMCEA